jgi:prevent-host-death family protein
MNTTTTKKNTIIGLKELREHMELYIRRVSKGESLTIMRRSEPIFKITPVDADDEAGWETVIDFTEINPNGVPAKDVLKALRAIHG